MATDGVMALNSEDKQTYVNICIERGDAPITPQYLLACHLGRPETYPPLREALGLSHKLENGGASANSCDPPQFCAQKRDAKEPLENIVKEGDSSNDKLPSKRLRGQNKDRRSNVQSIVAAHAQQLCSVIASTDGNCSFGDKCRSLHDKASFLETKPADLDAPCVHFSQRGLCPYGLNCRFSKDHVLDQYNVTAQGHRVTSESLKNLLPQCLNDLPDSVRIALRKRTYAFKPTTGVALGKNPLVSDETLLAPVNATSCEGALVTPDASHDRLAEIKRKRDVLFCSKKRLLAPLTTLGNLPFRRLCVNLGAEVTMSEMALATSILEGRPSELTLLKRHPCEKYFGVQLASGQPRLLEKCCSLISEEVSCDFVDLNIACPLEPLHKKLAGSILMTRPSLLRHLAHSMRTTVTSMPVTMKMRMSYDDKWNAHTLIPQLEREGVDAFFVHGRTSRQRYTKTANWEYLKECKSAASMAAVIGNGDVMCYDDYRRCQESSGCDNILIGRAALIKPWIFTEIKEERLWDISATERFDILRQFVNYGLEHWGSDGRGVEMTRRYFLELCSFTHRYIPVGLLEQAPQKMNWRPPAFVGRSDLETLLGSSSVKNWIKISEMFLGPVPDSFSFVPKHKSNAYEGGSIDEVY